MELVRIATAGSVDDGKSTLIGRLLYDSKSIFSDQLDAVVATSERMGSEHVNLALLTDGLRAEREQGITIDVAYRYFSTPRRSFIVADTPGHVQYTRNMVTGASTADLAVVLVDARRGLVEQSRRHTFLAALLGIPHLVVAVNKMDLVDWSRDRYEEISGEVTHFLSQLDPWAGRRNARPERDGDCPSVTGPPDRADSPPPFVDVAVVPVSALHGDNVVDESRNSPWFGGSSLLHHLEEVRIDRTRNLSDLRFPVQYVIRPHTDEHHDYRGYAGTVAGGVLAVGDEVVVLPSAITSRITAIDGPSGGIEAAAPGDACAVRLADDLDVGRGDMICGIADPPVVSRSFDAIVCWMSGDQPLREGATLLLKHTTRTVRAKVTGIRDRLDVNTLDLDEGSTGLALNDIGRITLRTGEVLFVDSYRDNRNTGSFILVDEVTNATVAAEMVSDLADSRPPATDRVGIAV
ncbi:MAG: GTP-binding protein [Microthrixaceae bacterium]